MITPGIRAGTWFMMEDCIGLGTAGGALHDVSSDLKRHRVCLSGSDSNLNLHGCLSTCVRVLDADAADRTVATLNFQWLV